MGNFVRNLGTAIRAVTAVVAVSTTGCVEGATGQFNEDPTGIVNGTETGYEIWKAAVAVVSMQGDQPAGICSGTLIHPQVVLTAGHCVLLNDDTQGSSYDHVSDPSDLLVAGGPTKATAIVYSGVQQAIPHPTWEGQLMPGVAVDLALLYLEEPVTEVGFHCVRKDPYVTNGDPGIIVGYGLVNSWQFNSSGVHRVGDTTILNVGPQVIEIGDPTATCQGDSGGPLFTAIDGRWELTGVTSYGESWTCDANSGAWSANAVVHRDWILDQVEALTGDVLDGCTNCGPEGFECEEAGQYTGGEDTETGADADTDTDADADTETDTGSQAQDTDPLPAQSGCGCSTMATPWGGLLRALAVFWS